MKKEKHSFPYPMKCIPYLKREIESIPWIAVEKKIGEASVTRVRKGSRGTMVVSMAVDRDLAMQARSLKVQEK